MGLRASLNRVPWGPSAFRTWHHAHFEYKQWHICQIQSFLPHTQWKVSTCGGLARYSHFHKSQDW